MDISQDLLRRLSQHRHRLSYEDKPRPMVRLACWNCGDVRQKPRPDGGLPCECGGVLSEVTGIADDLLEDD